VVEWLRANPGPVITSNHKVAPPSRLDMKSGMEDLIHHFKLYSEGFRVPQGEAYAAVEARRASSASTSSVTGPTSRTG
jgi:NADH-quinone oxidoreductase subunit D